MNKTELIKRIEGMGEYEPFVDEPISKRAVLNDISKLTDVETVKVIGDDQHLAELERQNAYLQRRLQSREYSLELHARTWGGQ